MKNTILIALAAIFMCAICYGSNKAQTTTSNIGQTTNIITPKKTPEELFKKAQKLLSEGKTNEGIDFLRAAAEQEHSEAQLLLGVCYYNGDDVEQNYSEAAKWFDKATEHGNVEQIVETAADLFFDEDIEDGLDPICSKLFQFAAEQGHKGAQFVMGYFGSTGENSIKWYTKAAEQGHREAMYMLGNMYFYADGVEQNYSEAVKWIKKAAENGDTWAMKELGIWYRNGFGVEQNYEKALYWYKEARDKGYRHETLCWDPIWQEETDWYEDMGYWVGEKNHIVWFAQGSHYRDLFEENYND